MIKNKWALALILSMSMLLQMSLGVCASEEEGEIIDAPISEEEWFEEDGSYEEDNGDEMDPELSEYIKEAQRELDLLAKQENLMALVYLCDFYQVKKAPDHEAETVVQAPSGTTVFLKGAELDADYNIWYQVSFEYRGNTCAGYIDRSYLAYSNEHLINWEDAYFPQMTMFAAASGSYPDVEQFPASYQAKLVSLKQAHPNWTFVKQNTGLDWKSVVNNENYRDRSLASSSLGAAYRGEYYGTGWYYASEAAVKYYLDPRNFLNEARIFQFEQLTYNPSYHSREAVQNILNSTFMKGALPGSDMTYADAFFQTGVNLLVSPFHLACRVYQEQGEGKSDLISGAYNTVPEYKGYYNYYNIGASGNTTKQIVESGLAKAVSLGWNTPYASIRGGAEILSKNYILRGQDTLYLQKFDVDASDGTLYTHQYMQNITAPYTESSMVRSAYTKTGALDSPFVFKIPVYNNMPSEACPVPTAVPTAVPTQSPTAKPTAAPAQSPTAAPTAVPTASPTAAPAQSPTAKPTAMPTASPTAAPTQSPTAKPTAMPTASPTAAPTQSPTAKPTAMPTASPTAAPAQSPTATPTAKPTVAPTASPTAAPTQSPTAKPGAVPTQSPTVKPTVAPIQLPAATPDVTATTSPATEPTAKASATAVAGVTPTAAAGATPIATPAVRPTVTLAQSPTAKPGATPIQSPTARPGATPIQSPTAKPTVAPIQSPTVTPAASAGVTPTAAASITPAASAAATPTATPTATPAQSPAVKPTPTPAAAAGAAPTTIPVAGTSPASQPGGGSNTSSGGAAPTADVPAAVSTAEPGNGMPANEPAAVNVEEGVNSAGVTVAAVTPRPHAATEDKDMLTMDMGKTGIIYAQTLQQIKEQKREVILKMSDQVSWIIDGSTIETDELKDINLKVSLGSSQIPKRKLEALTENEIYTEMSLEHEGEFGFTVVLSVQLDNAQPGQYANLFYYNEQTGNFEFMCASLISSRCAADFEFRHASDYIIIISDSTKENLLEIKAHDLAQAQEQIVEAMAQAKEELPAREPGKAAGIIVLILLACVALGIGAYLLFKKER